MAILCLADSPADLRARLGPHPGRLLAAGRAGARRARCRSSGAMAAILNEALLPNLVQSREGTPAFVHGGPFANIAHGCNSVLATRMALAHGRLRRDRGRVRLRPRRREVLRHQVPVGGAEPRRRRDRGHHPRPQDARRRRPRRSSRRPTRRPSSAGWRTCAAHLDSAETFRQADGRGDQPVRHRHRRRRSSGRPRLLRSRECPAPRPTSSRRGGAGATELAEKVVAAADGPETRRSRPLYPLDGPAERKIEQIARAMYGARDVAILPAAEAKLQG